MFRTLRKAFSNRPTPRRCSIASRHWHGLLEDRKLMAYNIDFVAGGDLFITGTNRNDTINVTSTNSVHQGQQQLRVRQ